MSTQAVPPPKTSSTVRPYRLTVRQFLKAVKAGVFPDEARIELLGGVPVEKMTRYPPHNVTVLKLGSALRSLLPADWFVSEEKPIVAGRRWRPEPDLAVIRGPIDRYLRDDPKPADVALVIEVADSSYSKDRGVKWRQYAAAGLAFYWIVDLKNSQLEVYSDPTGRGNSASYRNVTIYKKGDTAPITIEGVEIGRIAVNDFIPIRD